MCLTVLFCGSNDTNLNILIKKKTICVLLIFKFNDFVKEHFLNFGLLNIFGLYVLKSVVLTNEKINYTP